MDEYDDIERLRVLLRAAREPAERIARYSEADAAKEWGRVAVAGLDAIGELCTVMDRAVEAHVETQ